MARSTSKEALGLVKGTSESAQKLRSLIQKMDHGLQRSLTEKELGDHFHQKFRQSVGQKSHANYGDRKRLSKARVITTQEVVELREAREAADEEKAAKTAARKAKAVVKEERLHSYAKNTATTPPPRSKKKVLISDRVTVHTIEDDAWVDEITEAIGDLGMEGEAEHSRGVGFVGRSPLPALKRVTKAWEKAQKDRSTGSL